MNYQINPVLLLKKILTLIFWLLIANLLAIGIKLNTDQSFLLGIAALFDFNREGNIPTLYSTLALFVCSVLLLYVFWRGKIEGRKAFPWLLLALVFLFLSVDEFGMIHEHLNPLMRSNYGLSGILYYGWIVPYGIACIILAIIFLPFLLRLSSNTRNLFILSGAIFLGGAVGVESVSGLVHELSGTQNLVYTMLYTIEELMEMVGIAIFIYALTKHILSLRNVPHINISLNPAIKWTINQEEIEDLDSNASEQSIAEQRTFK